MDQMTAFYVQLEKEEGLSGGASRALAGWKRHFPQTEATHLFVNPQVTTFKETPAVDGLIVHSAKVGKSLVGVGVLANAQT